jgi:hypothetical protein
MPINSNVGYIISNCFPNLIDTKLTDELVENAHIALKNPHFRKAEFYIHHLESYLPDEKYEDLYPKYGFSLKCPNMIEAQYYICNPFRKTRTNCENIQSLPLLSVETSTEKRSKADDLAIYIHCFGKSLVLLLIHCRCLKYEIHRNNNIILKYHFIFLLFSYKHLFYVPHCVNI